MISQEALKSLIHGQGVSRRDKCLFVLAAGAKQTLTIKEIKTLGTAAGLREISRWNVSDVLGRSTGLALNTESGWELSPKGKSHFEGLAGLDAADSTTRTVTHSLRKHIDDIADTDTRNFIEEAVKCYEHRLYRSAVVLSWVGAISLLQTHVAETQLAPFNKRSRMLNKKWRPAKSTDDLGKMPEHDFLEVLEDISVLGKNVKQKLQNQLKLRNACGHPNSFKLGTHAVADHIETLALNVFSKF